MIRTVITPDKEDFFIHVPHNYVGKEIELLMFAKDELTEEKAVKKTFRSAGLLGALALTEDRYNELQQYAKDIRNEWDKNI